MLLRAAPSAPTAPDGVTAPSAPFPANRARWIHSPVADLALGFCWVPFALATVLAPDASARNAFVAAVFLLSFAHQPLTLALVYGDADQFRLRRAVFTWSPFVFAAAVFAAVNINFLILAVVGGLWNAEHTLMQRYGLTRIYGRKAGQDEGRLEKALLFSFLILALLWVGADAATPDHLEVVDIGANNRRGVEVLTSLRPYALVVLVPALAAAVGLLGAWLVTEVRRARVGEANPAKWLYMAATIGVFALVPFQPVAALMGYVGAHAVEYFVIVSQSLGRRYRGPEAADASPLGRAVRARPGRAGFLVVYLLTIIALVAFLQVKGSPVLYAVVFFTLGGLHVFYDGFIWKLRRREVASSLAIPSS